MILPPKVIILAIDGGGIKGLIPAYFLSELEKRLSVPCYKLFDIIGGTSTGGIIATGLTSPVTTNGMPLSAEDIMEIYQTHGGDIFVPQGDGNGVEWAEYYADNNGQGIEPYLQDKFGAYTLKEAKDNMTNRLKGRTKHVFTTSYTINSSGGTIITPVSGKDYGPYLFNWMDASDHVADNYRVWEAARASSAAPVYFPVAHVGGGRGPNNSSASERWALDGGVMSNNPAVWSIAEAFRTGLAKSLKEIVLISLGTGTYACGAGLGISTNTHWSVPANGNWGESPWLLSDLYDLSGKENSKGALINIITEAVQLVSNQQISSLISAGLTYLRIEPPITQAQSQMDDIDPDNINSLLQTAKAYIQTGKGASTFNDIINAIQPHS